MYVYVSCNWLKTTGSPSSRIDRCDVSDDLVTGDVSELKPLSDFEVLRYK